MAEIAKQTAGLLKEREGILREILSLTREQPELIAEEENTDKLLANMSRRQDLIDRIAGLDLMHLPPAEEEKALLADIRGQEEANEKLASGIMGELREKLCRNRAGLTSLRGYDQNGEIDAVFFDKQK